MKKFKLAIMAASMMVATTGGANAAVSSWSVTGVSQGSTTVHLASSVTDAGSVTGDIIGTVTSTPGVTGAVDGKVLASAALKKNGKYSIETTSLPSDVKVGFVGSATEVPTVVIASSNVPVGATVSADQGYIVMSGLTTTKAGQKSVDVVVNYYGQ